MKALVNEHVEQANPAPVPQMSYEEAKATISWWENNKRAGSIEPMRVKLAREILQPLFVESPAPVKEAEVKPLNKITELKLSKPISEFSLADIQPEIDRLNGLAKHAGVDNQKKIDSLKAALFNRRWYLKKKTKEDAAANQQSIPQEAIIIPSKISELPKNEVVEIPQEVPQKQDLDQLPMSTSGPDPAVLSKVCTLKTYSSAVATFNFPEITISVTNVEDIKEAIISGLLKQVEEIARKELGL